MKHLAYRKSNGFLNFSIFEGKRFAREKAKNVMPVLQMQLENVASRISKLHSLPFIDSCKRITFVQNEKYDAKQNKKTCLQNENCLGMTSKLANKANQHTILRVKKTCSMRIVY